MGCSDGQPIAFTRPPSALCTGRPHYHPSPPFANTAVGQLPSVWSAPLRNSTLPLPGYPNLCPPRTRAGLRTIITAFSSKAPPKPTTLLHGLARRLTQRSTYHSTPYITRLQTLLRKSLSSRSPQLISYRFRCGGYLPSPTKPSELLCCSHSSLTG